MKDFKTPIIAKKKPRFRIKLAILLLAGFFLLFKLNHKTSPTISPEIKTAHLELPQSEEDQEISNSIATHSQSNWISVDTKPNDSLATILQNAGVDALALALLLKNDKYKKILSNITPNQQIKLELNGNTLEKLIYPIDETQYLQAEKTETGYQIKQKKYPTTLEEQYSVATVNGSLYKTALNSHIPYKLIQQMAQIFHWQMDFNREVRDGDQFSLIYETYSVNGESKKTGNIIAATYNGQRKSMQAIRYVQKNGHADYYTREGNSLKKAFDRYPVKFSHISSTFSMNRYHPVLNYRRPHKGVDLAAPIGTPIRAVGDGRIVLLEYQNGFGNVIKIKHDTTYSSLYAHMLRFQKGITNGSHVKRGQVIGYVGQSGLANGPHCHFELHINRQPRNPTTASLPSGTPLPPTEKREFVSKANMLLANLELYQAAKFASNETKTSTA